MFQRGVGVLGVVILFWCGFLCSRWVSEGVSEVSGGLRRGVVFGGHLLPDPPHPVFFFFKKKDRRIKCVNKNRTAAR
jgi:hypothetical protein